MRKSSLMRRFFVFFLFFSVLLIFYIQAQMVKIKQENGVTVVYNPKKPAPLPGMPTKLILTEDLRIGAESGDENYMFSSLNSVQVDEEGDIIVFDRKEVCIKVFDKNGKFLRKFGKKGQGPGEIQSPYKIHLAGGKDITIMDRGNNRFSYYSKDGRCIKEIGVGKYRLFMALADSRGYIYGYLVTLGDKVTLDLIKFNQEFKPIMTIISREMPKKPPPAELTELFHFHVIEDDSFIWGRTFKYELNILDRDGKLVKRIVKDYEPIKITKDNLKREYKRRYPDRPLPSQLPKIPDHWPKYYPIFYYFLCDDEGRIYVRTYERDKQDNIYYDVFDAEGRYFAKFSHPDNELITVIKNKRTYCLIKADEEGIPLIKRYKMEWK